MTGVKFRTFSAIVALVVLLIVTNDGLRTSADGGLVNPGFESGALNGSPVGWTVVNPVADVVRVVDTEGPAQFATYGDMANITVAPYRGNLMLRTGTPQRLDQKQNKGDNLVRQTFSSTSSTLDFAFRVFSWEHRGQDLVKFDIKDLSAPTPSNQDPPSVGDLVEPIEILDANGATMAPPCADIPCEFSLDAGNQGQFIDTGWQVVRVVNLPVDHDLSLSYQVSGTKDASKPTWAYWDNVNTPPVAKFAFAPSNPREGDVVQFVDLSYDPDPGDSIVSRTWVIDGQTLTTQNPFFVFPDEADYVVSITVQDTFGAVTVALDSTTALDGDPIPDLVVGNADPLVNALNMEALAGHDLTLRGRYLDAGYLDTHTASWAINGNPAALVEEENDPMLSSGLVTGVLTAETGLTGGTMTVDDGDEGSASDPFTVTVVPDTPESRERYEPNDTTLTAPAVASDNAILSFLQEEGDIDIYEARAADGGPVKSGSEILISATNLSADIDIAILSELPAAIANGWSNNGWSSNGWSSNGWSNNGWSNNGWSNNGWSNNGWSNNGWSSVGGAQVGLQSFEQSGVSWADIGWSNNGWSNNGYLSGGNEVNALDVDIAELGLATVGGDNLQVADFSANRGLDDEVAWARSANAETTFYVAVFTSDGEESLSPYTLSVEIIEPPELEPSLGPLCAGSKLVTTGATEGPEILYDYDDPLTPENDANAVFITSKQRMQATYGMDEVAWSNFMGAGDAVGLVDLAQHSKVRADILSVPSVFLDQFDEHPCSVAAANSAATQIRGLVNALYPNVEHRVVLGNDVIIPFLRKIDHTVIGNQKDYLLDSFTKAGSPLFAALLQGYMITDDHLGEGVDSDGNPTSNPWQGEEAYVPTIGVGRLVETPQEILWHVQAALASDLTLRPSSAAMFGYDTFGDGAELIRDNLVDEGLNGEVVSRTDDLWTKDDMRCLFLGVGNDASCGVRDIVSPNGHSTHWAILAAAGFGDGQNIDYTDHLGSSEVAALGNGTQPLKDTLVLAMGCNLGFNSPDAYSEGPDEELGITPAMDFPQAFAQHGTMAILSTGFAYSDDAGVGGHEKLFSILPEEMFAEGATIGQALATAKQRYLGGLVTVSVYDLKVSMETTLYGLPMYTVEPAEAASMLLAVQEEENLSAGTPLETPFALTTVDPGAEVETKLTTYQREANGSLPPDGDGIHYTLNGDAEGAVGRTLQPSFEDDVDKRHYPNSPQPANPVHGVRITGGAYEDIANDPVFTRPKHTWDLNDNEVQQCQTGYSPSNVAGINSFQRGQNLTQTLVGVAGQFRCTDTVDGVVLGVERLYSSLNLELRRCAGDNTDGPTLNGIELRDGVVPGTVDVRIDASDMEASDSVGLTRVEVLRVDEGSVFPVAATLTQVLPAEGAFRGIYNASVDSVEQTTDMLVQVEDTDCNVTLDTFKSAGINFLKVDAGPDQLMPADRTVTLTGTISNFDDLVSPAWFDWQFGDGTFLDGVLLPASKATVPVTVDAFGTATFSVQHTYAAGIPTPITATLEVHDSAGGNGSDETHIVCDPTADADGPDGDWVGCSSSNTSTKMTISAVVDGTVSGQFQYRVYVDAGKYNTKKKRWEQPPDGVFDALLKYNAGQVTGLTSLTVRVIGNELRFTFDLAEFGLTKDNVIRWYAETQAGIPGEPTTGKVDRMPDADWLSHKIIQ